MDVDIGARIRPIKEYFSLVVEAQFLNQPSNTGWDAAFFTNNRDQIRSAYVISDNLPYNSYAMYGLYRPMFRTLRSRS